MSSAIALVDRDWAIDERMGSNVNLRLGAADRRRASKRLHAGVKRNLASSCLRAFVRGLT